jgi:SAM-dependent methyltransferase
MMTSIVRELFGKIAGGGGYTPYFLRRERHQVEFRKNRERIARGEVPERYQRTADLVPGSRVLDIGSADGTLALVLAQRKEFVIGAELMNYRHKTAQEMKSIWAKRGAKTENLRFVNRGVKRVRPFLKQVDTIVISRALYHLRDDAYWLFNQVDRFPNIKYVALFGNRTKEKEWLDTGGSAPGLGQYLGLAGQVGMEEILTRHGFDIETSLASTDTEDPVVIGVKT